MTRPLFSSSHLVYVVRRDPNGRWTLVRVKAGTAAAISEGGLALSADGALTGPPELRRRLHARRESRAAPRSCVVGAQRRRETDGPPPGCNPLAAR
jgi:hypothetical protein